MSKICVVTGKKPSTGNLVSHSNRKTKRWIKPNVVVRSVTDPDTGIKIRVPLSNKGLKIIKKNPSKLRAALAAM